MARVFVGIILPDSLKDSVLKIQKDLEELPIECKFVERENLHISLDFIGEVEKEKLEEIKDKISEITSSIKKFSIEFGEMKLIPNERLVRVIALDVKSAELPKIGIEIEKKIGGDAKPPHLTLCRMKNVLNRTKFLEIFEKIKNKKINSFEVTSIQLIESKLNSQGPVYSVVSGFSLV